MKLLNIALHLIMIYILGLLTRQVESGTYMANVETLRFLHTICRHGDRNPVVLLATDMENNESSWSGGLGELTQLGIRQQYRTGQFIKRRYAGFLSEEYDPEEIHVQSTAVNRTIDSAIAILQGLYSTRSKEILWNEELISQSIPVHSKPKDEDLLLWMHQPCEKEKELHKNIMHSSQAYLEIERSNSAFIEFVRQKTGRHSLPLLHMIEVFDPLKCEAIHNETHKWPVWVNQSIYDRIADLTRKSTRFYAHLPELKRIRGSLLFHDIAARMYEKVQNKSKSLRKLKHYLFSAHDTTQIALLENLDVFDGDLPPYGHVLAFELHEVDAKHYVKLYKRNGLDAEDVVQILLPLCGEPCLLEKFLKISSVNLPINWYNECFVTKACSTESTCIE